MISVNHNLSDAYAIYGLNHFLFKYGIAAKVTKSKKPYIEIGYTNSAGTKGSILVQTFSVESIQRDIKGYLHTDNETVPIFEVARELNEPGRVLATFQGRGIAYPCFIINSSGLTMGF
ncbi:hypothetical protein KAR91_77735, partial [Candidatus Pacearchaeota archaeon]|nr:hypothetical protein [Candidatus Pacearchaeota archaeon]